jgi:predicted ferric reductase/Ca2+-binding EF-hand superfamily protein
VTPDVQALRNELAHLTASFDAIAGPVGGRITPAVFQRALELRSEFVANHLFRLFDRDGNGVIDRDEFISTLEQLLTGTVELKLAFLFQVHDQDRDGAIERLELERLVHLGLAESSLALPDALVEEMIDALFQASDLDGDGRISFAEFAAVFAGYPALLERVTRADAVWRALRQHDTAARDDDELRVSWLRRAANWIEEHGAAAVVLLLYVVANVALFVGAVVRYHEAGANGFVQLARGCGACLNFNCALILVPMLRHLLTWIRARSFGRFVPVDHAVEFHKQVGHAIFGFSLVHTLAHLCNYAISSEPVLDSLVRTKPGLTGVLALVVTALIWAFALEPVRRARHFQLFHFVHLLYWLFLPLLLLHGPVYWIWASVPIAGYLIERAVRLATRANDVAVETEQLASGVTKLSFAAPPNWRHRAGDYLFIELPLVARHEWHPFTISSAPERRELTLHVRSLGNWTAALHELAGSRVGHVHAAPLLGRIDGPYGTPSAHIFEVKFAVLIGAGIGVTPFAAILDSILEQQRAGTLERVHFVWVNRDQYAFEWFAELLARFEAQDDRHLLDIHIYMTGGREHLDATALELCREVFYAKTHRDVVTGLRARTQFGRPDWEALLTEILREHAPERVEVFMCGPTALTKVLQPLCARLGMGFRHEIF